MAGKRKGERRGPSAARKTGGGTAGAGNTWLLVNLPARISQQLRVLAAARGMTKRALLRAMAAREVGEAERTREIQRAAG